MPRGRLIGSLFLLLALLLAALILTDAIPHLRGPAPETSEWYWPYMLRPLSRWWAAVAAALGVAGLAAWWLRRESDRDGVPLLLLFLLVLALQLGLLYADRPAIGAELVDRTLSKASSGYLATAGEIDELGDALRRFPQLMAAFDNDHARTHPPGLIAAHWLSDHALRRAPALAEALARPATYWRCTDLWVLARPPATAASLLIWSWIPPLLAALIVYPAYRLGRRWFAPLPARLATLLAGTLPALLVFTPTADQIFATLAILSLLLLVVGLHDGRRAAIVASGLVLSLMSFLSLGNVAWAGLLGFYALWWTVRPNESDARDTTWRWGALLLLATAMSAFWLVYWIGWGVPPWEIARVGLDQHYELVTRLRRYDWWLGYNLLDFVLFAGPPVVFGLMWRVAGALRSPAERNSADGRFALLLIGLLLALNLAGSTRGEVGRLWLVFMPAAAVVAGGILGRRLGDWRNVWLLLVAQLILVLSIGLGWRPFYAVILPVERPALATELPDINLDATFITTDGPEIHLLGYDAPDSLTVAGSSITTTLYWQADGATLRPYTVFLQLLDSAGQIVAQQDRWPVAGQWPTTCWVAGEVVPDNYEIPLPAELPPGTYRLVVGLYNAATGERLLTAGGSDNVVLAEIVVAADGAEEIGD